LEKKVQELEKQLEVERMYEPLTGLFTRRHFTNEAHHLIKPFLHFREEELRSKSKPVSFLFCDIDKFKSVNDTYGHKVGDEVLKQVANIIRQI